MGKRKYRLNDQRIRDATAQFDTNQDVGAFLRMVSRTVNTYMQRNLSDDNDVNEEEEHLLAPLQGDVPVEFNIVGRYRYRMSKKLIKQYSFRIFSKKICTDDFLIYPLA